MGKLRTTLKKLQRFLGVTLGIAAGLCIAISAMSLKFLHEPIITKTLVMVNIQIYLLSLPLMTYQKPHGFLEINRSTVMLLVLNGVSIYASMFCFFQAVKYVPMGEALALATTYPPIATILACILLKETFKILDGILLVTITIGVFLIAQPEFLFGGATQSQNKVLGVAFAVGSSTTCAIGILVTRKLKTDVVVAENLLSVAIPALIGSCIELSSVENGFLIPCLRDVKWMFLGGVFFLAGYGLRYFALQIERVGPVSVAYTGQIAFGYVFDLFIFHVPINVISICGGSLIFLSCVATTVTQCAFENRQKSNYHHESENREEENSIVL
ncbi:solute carrier family 35 member G1-like [Clavelina lepadiformis]|uniref:solute carrier family 35 member G1-like n=1 Tax=Clavelina lepadiformis TaxID=159417 RepID=UPI0040432FEA